MADFKWLESFAPDRWQKTGGSSAILKITLEEFAERSGHPVPGALTAFRQWLFAQHGQPYAVAWTNPSDAAEEILIVRTG